MTLHLHTATRTDLLADGLGRLLSDAPADPFAEELVVVPAKGVERWLAQRLSHRLGAAPGAGDGVCAGVRFVNPRSLVALLLGTEDDDPWDPDRSVWPLLGVVDASLDEPWCVMLGRHLGQGVEGERRELRRDRRYAVVRRIAGLFAAYGVQRPALLEDWSAGRDTDGAGAALAADLAWQPELWRRLVAVVDAPSPHERHRRAVTAAREGRLALPDRLSLFGHTRLPLTELELLRAVADSRELHLWLPQPSPVAWDRLADHVADGPVRRRDDDSARLVRHPLLSSLGRDTRELQRSLTVLQPVEREVLPDADAEVPAAPPPVAAHPALLGRLQAQLRADDPPPRTAAAPAGQDPPGPSPDRSVQVHACHGATRQVEVLREVLVGLLQDDPNLEPRDVLVMCPDVETYAPLFSAAFGLGSVDADRVHPAHGLRVRLADRGLMSVNPLLALAGALVALAGGRGTASEVLDLAASEPVRTRFGWSDDDLAQVTTWVAQARVRWGLTPALRAPYRLDDLPHNTWQAGLDRLLLGVAMAEEEDSQLGTTLPVDDVGSAAVDLAGRLAELVSRLERSVTRLRAARTAADWVAALHDGVLDVGTVAAVDGWQLGQFERELAGVLHAQGQASGGGPHLRLADVRVLLEQRLQPRPTRANFRTGNLTVATLVPMRSVPHRVVCLLGLDDGVFPRSTAPDGDDVLARDPLTGERDARSEDRQLLLDAVLAARDTLVVTYTGANEHNGQERPPAVPLGELLDALERTQPGARDQVLVRHPLQPFDDRNFLPGELGEPGPFSFDTAACEGAAAARGPRSAPVGLRDRRLTSRRPQDVGLADLRRMLLHPVRGFLGQRLDVGVPADQPEVADALPVEISGLEAWEVGDRVLRAVLAGAEPAAVLAAERLRGALPPLQLGRRQLATIEERAHALWSATRSARELPATTRDVTVDLGGGRRLTGVVADLRGHRLVRVHYSNLGPRHRLGSWIDLVALSASDPDASWTASTYGWHRTGPRHALLGPVDHTVHDLLAQLVDLHDRGLREPLPLPLGTGHAWADSRRAHRDPDRSSRSEWEGSEGSPVPGEREDAWHERLLGRAAPFEVLLEAPEADERWGSEGTRLGQYAARLWEPLFAHEQVMSA